MEICVSRRNPDMYRLTPLGLQRLRNPRQPIFRSGDNGRTQENSAPR
jgi:hypothetical protein